MCCLNGTVENQILRRNIALGKYTTWVFQKIISSKRIVWVLSRAIERKQ
jgi:hypothetical protein